MSFPCDVGFKFLIDFEIGKLQKFFCAKTRAAVSNVLVL